MPGGFLVSAERFMDAGAPALGGGKSGAPACTVSQVRERPLLFKAPMVRALLAGKKTQTRRLVEDAPGWASEARYTAFTPKGSVSFRGVHPTAGYGESFVRCRYGVPGDLLWVKETWRPTHGHGHGSCECSSVRVSYAADGGWKEFAPEVVDVDWKVPKAALRGKNVTPLFMPRWASRITLEVIDVRVERLRGISEEDARREGVTSDLQCELGNPGGLDWWPSLRAGFEALWRSINGPESWDENPWVWVVSFRRVHP
jgi:hypothetical protein